MEKNRQGLDIIIINMPKDIKENMNKMSKRYKRDSNKMSKYRNIIYKLKINHWMELRTLLSISKEIISEPKERAISRNSPDSFWIKKKRKERKKEGRKKEKERTGVGKEF